MSVISKSEVDIFPPDGNNKVYCAFVIVPRPRKRVIVVFSLARHALRVMDLAVSI
jgi:hypothetical protein